MILADELTVVIPNKNEGINLYYCLSSIDMQKGFSGMNVIIADASDAGREPVINHEAYSNLNITVIPGGLPGYARWVGSLEADTRYILFLDADMILLNRSLFLDIFKKYRYNDFDLLTIPFRTERGWDWCYRVFDFIQLISHKIARQPFAIGGFQLFKSSAYWLIGGYNPLQEFAEDYSVSLKISANKFVVFKQKYGVYTSPRRFENKGLRYMIWLMFKTYLNRNDKGWFEKSHGYWD